MSGSYPLQKSFLLETLKTIELLFPCADPKSSRFIEQFQKQHNLDEEFPKSYIAPPTSDDDFQFYRAKLAILFDELQHTGPTSISQLWRDRRNKQQWLTFWVGVLVFILTIFFGAISAVTSIMQTDLAYRSLRLQEKHGL